MRTMLNVILIGVILIFLNGCIESLEKSQTKNDAPHEFKGKVAKTYEESEEWWPTKKKPPKDAPNVILFMILFQ